MGAVELELKVRVTNHDAVLRRLVDLAAEPIEVIAEDNIFLDDAGGQLLSAGAGLRVRAEAIGPLALDGSGTPDGRVRVRVTWKGPRTEAGRMKQRAEREFVASDLDATLDVFAALGYREILRFDKRRRRFRLAGCTVELDEVPELSPASHFVEVEGPSADAIRVAADRLGLADAPAELAGYAALVAATRGG